METGSVVTCSTEEGFNGSVAEETVDYSAVGCSDTTSVIYSTTIYSDCAYEVCIIGCSVVGCSGGPTIYKVALIVAWLGGEEISLNILV